MPALARMTAANLPFVLTPEPLQSPRATSALLLPDYKRLYTGDTCLLIPRVTLPYHNSMACSSHNSGKRSSPLSAKHKCGSDSLAPAQVRTMAQNGPKRPKTARNGPLGLPHSYLGSGPLFGPQRHHLTPISNTKRPKMDQNGTEIKNCPLWKPRRRTGNHWLSIAQPL